MAFILDSSQGAQEKILNSRSSRVEGRPIVYMPCPHVLVMLAEHQLDRACTTVTLPPLKKQTVLLGWRISAALPRIRLSHRSRQRADASAGCSCGQKHLSFPNVREWLNSADNVRVYSFTINHLGSLILIVCDMLTAPSHSGDRGAHSVFKNIKGILQGACNDW